MVMEKPSPLLVGREFVRQYYTLLNQAPDMLHRFYGKNSSYAHGGLDSNGKPADAVYGQKEIHRKVMSQNFTNCHTKIRHVDARATLNDGYQDEVFGGFVTEPQDGSEEEVEEPEESQQTPEVVPDDSGTFYEQTVSNDLEEHLEEPLWSRSQNERQSQNQSLCLISRRTRLSLHRRKLLLSIKNLPPSGAVPVTGTPPQVVKVPPSQPRPESKPESQIPPQRPQRDQRVREQRINIPPQRGPRPIREAGEPGDVEPRRMVRHPDSHQLFLGSLPHEVDKSELKDFFQNYGNMVEMRINSGGKLPSFGFVVFDDCEPVQKALNHRPLMFRGAVRLNVEEKKTRAAREGDRRDNGLRGPGGPRGVRNLCKRQEKHTGVPIINQQLFRKPTDKHRESWLHTQRLPFFVLSMQLSSQKSFAQRSISDRLSQKQENLKDCPTLTWSVNQIIYGTDNHVGKCHYEFGSPEPIKLMQLSGGRV
ncbi:ras GTPase-activating protein-binding protein 1 [Cricetulus griseus]|nr:ras GTPase-activating protein-binding protein 1 [Cricetulus griseus]